MTLSNRNIGRTREAFKYAFLEVGQTWISDTGNCWRVVDLLDNRAVVERIATMIPGQPIYQLAGKSRYCFHNAIFASPLFRKISGNPDRFDAWLQVNAESVKSIL